ncbi:outer membrane lipoprotein carrier protein LolA [Aromatoleum petrolei]|uniref:Outer membrane lipoprotein carrier protein LolA n=1 Tax=Aromatoleum petrolei TaxID=76116 RepID=A0ABX1MSD8_9RHOO|nr:outer membrane lipoprotein carrier protein LolA [Aromatoleum petrolei]NMF88032.1 outer membrane lipoprotein carrier protein LolA [Aromatoleum petrolei]
MFKAASMRLLVAALLAAASLLHGPQAGAAESWTVAQLMQALGKHRSGQATFQERKYLAVLDQPVESSGELRFQAPDRLEKITLKPRPEALVLEGNNLSVTRGKKQFNVRLSDYGEVAGFIDSIRATLAGDRDTLERTYALHLAGNAERWTLTLLPRDTRMAEVVTRINISGSRGLLREIEILQADGDRSVMEIVALGQAR